mgnify:CR=1 FL=1
MYRQKIKRIVAVSFLGISFFCVFVYAYDLLFGDGIIARFSINPLSIWLGFSIPLLLIAGIASRSKWISNGSLLLFSTIGILFILEKLLPAVATYQAGIHDSIQRIDDVFPYSTLDTVYFKNYVPNASFRTQLRPEDGGRNILHQINEHGMRGPSPGLKEAGEQRILLVGDSYLQATQVAYEESLGPVLSSLLPDSFSVVQHGFPSWSPLLEWNWILRKGLSFEPNMVVLFLYNNDFFSGDAIGDNGYLPYAKFAENGEPAGFDFSQLESKYLGLKKRNPWTMMIADLQRFRLVRLTTFLLRRQLVFETLSEEKIDTYLNLPPEAFQQAYRDNNTTKDILTVMLWDYLALMRDTSQWSPDLQERVELSFKHLEGLQQSLDERGVEFAICHIPYPWQFPGENAVRMQEVTNWSDYVFPEGGIQQAVKTFCASKDIPLLDLYSHTQESKTAAPELQLYCPSDPHWTVAGHDMAAHALYNFLAAHFYPLAQ